MELVQTGRKPDLGSLFFTVLKLSSKSSLNELIDNGEPIL